VSAEPRVFALSMHATYACRHSGACCTAGWAIPVEPERQALLGGEVLIPDEHGACRHYDRASRRCQVHRDHGAEALPASCFQFPRRALVDDRGVFVTLSHFCPTAAELLVHSAGPLSIVESPSAFPAGRGYDGLDGRGAWPPLVKANLLFDLASFTRWERLVVATFARSDLNPAAALRAMASLVEEVRAWTPGLGPLDSWVAALARRVPPAQADAAFERYHTFTALAAYDRLLTMVPEGLARPVLSEAVRRRHERDPWDWGAQTPAVMRYLAAKAFGSWSSYESHGIRTLVAELTVSELVLRLAAAAAMERHRRADLDAHTLVEAVRAADWLLIHLMERTAFVRWLGAVEKP
jgi:hypothetical protein